MNAPSAQYRTVPLSQHKLIILSSNPNTLNSIRTDQKPHNRVWLRCAEPVSGAGSRSSSKSSQQRRKPSIRMWALLCSISAAARIVASLDGLSSDDEAPSAGRLDNESQLSGGCELLFMTNDNLANYCSCQNGEPNEELQKQQQQRLDGHNPGAKPTITGESALPHIGQLACSPTNFTQIKLDLAELLLPAKGAPSNNSPAINHFRLDHLSISTNLSFAPESAIYHEPVREKLELSTSSSSSSLDRPKHKSSLLIDHISLQLTVAEPRENRSAFGRKLEEQMIDFVRLINETHLQFLSIFIELGRISFVKVDDVSGKTDQVGVNSNTFPKTEISFDRLLARFAQLSRLELSSADAKGELLLSMGSGSLQQQARLKWLNLASNVGLDLAGLAQVDFGSGATLPAAAENKNSSSFKWSPNIEYLSLESCNLKNFPLFSMFALPFKVSIKSSHNKPDEPDHNSTIFHGMPNLNLLNLAGNKLASFERDLFVSSGRMAESRQIGSVCSISERKHDKHSRIFLLPLLTQLDLSSNRLSDLSFKVGQYILCSMPNLNQLYLQRNKIVQLNLNSLLSFPFSSKPKPMHYNASIEEPSRASTLLDAGPSQVAVKNSRLEYIDLSFNLLNRITGVHQKQQYNSPSSARVRIKSINLSHNRLRSPFDYIDSNLIDRLVFKESFDEDSVDIRRNSLSDLESSFVQLADDGNSSTLCDFLSPKSDQTNGELLNEVILSSNELEKLSRKDFSSSQCRDIQVLRISNNRIASIGEDSLIALENLEQLDLSYNSLVELSDNTFAKNIKLRILNLSKNKIERLNQTIFSQLVDLEELFIDNNGLIELESTMFSRNNRLNLLDLSKNKLSRLDMATFAELNQLRKLDLTGNQLKQFSHHLFESLQSIVVSGDDGPPLESKQETRVQSRKSQSRTKNMKATRPKLKKKRTRRSMDDSNSLNLASNDIDSITFDYCGHIIQSIQILKLSENKLETLSGSSFSCLKSIRLLFLQSNRIRSLAETTFKNMSELEYLDLSRNQIDLVQPRTLSFSGALRHVDLSGNRLLTLKLVQIFGIGHSKSLNLPSIESLNLSNNLNLTLDVIDLQDFIFHTSLRELNLAHIKRIQHIGTENATIQHDKVHLDVVDISSVLMIDVLFVAILSQPSIEIGKLDLARTQTSGTYGIELGHLVRRQLQSSLTELNLAGNRLDDRLFGKLMKNSTKQNQVGRLSLASNDIENWPFDEQLASCFSSLKHLNIGDNRMRYFIRNDSSSYGFSQLEILNLSSNALISLIEHPLHGKTRLSDLMPRIRELNLSNNRLTWLPSQFFQNLDELSWLRLDHNQLEIVPLIAFYWRVIVDLRLNQRLLDATSNEKTDLKELDDENLVLMSISSGTQFPLECKSIDAYISDRRRGSSSMKVEELQEDQDEDRNDNERCSNLIKTIDSILLESVQVAANLVTIKGASEKYTHLSVYKSGLTNMVAYLKRSDIIVLDLHENKISNSPVATCTEVSALRSLDLSRNQLKLLPVELILSCRKLNYLDLSHNRISSLGEVVGSSRISSLEILKLDDNLLTDLRGLDIYAFKSLRYVELSSNRIKTSHFYPSIHSFSLLRAIADIESTRAVSSTVPAIRLAGDVLIFHWPTEGNVRDKYSLSIMQNGINEAFTAISNENLEHTIKLCTLSFRGLVDICVKLEGEFNRCFKLKIPESIASCVTNLEKAIDGHKSGNRSYRNPLDSVALTYTEHFEQEDSVLRFINYLKNNWLKVRELNVTEYLTTVSNISVDSVLFDLDGRHPVKTLLVMKWAIVLSAICIVVLLIAMFVLLTRQGTYENSSPCSEKPNDYTMNTANDSDTSSSVINKTSSTSTNSDSSTAQAGLLPTTSSSVSSESRTSKGDGQQNTILERKAGLHLDANQLLQRDQQHQACSTPSLSLAPSSVETAETMQAVDSIKSGVSTLCYDNANRNHVENYLESRAGANYASYQPQQQVATVMRMIKSNSANFDASSNSSRSVIKHPDSGQNTRYSTLRSKIFAINRQQQLGGRIHPIQIAPQHYQHPQVSYQLLEDPHSVHRLEDPMHSSYMNSYETSGAISLNRGSDQTLVDQDQDPTTMSLLSINTALSNCFQPAPNQQTAAFAAEKSSNLNLCQYHHMLQVHEQPPPPPPPVGAVQEQAEQWTDSIQARDVPPPPPIRTLEVLENSSGQMSGSLNYTYKTQYQDYK